MKALRTISFLVIFIVASATLIYFKFQESERQQELLELAKSQVLLPGSLSDEINYLSFERLGNSPIVLKREGGNWKITSPVKTQADIMVIQGVVAALRFGRKEESFVSEEDKESYGFKNSLIRIVVGNSKSPRKSTLLLGNKVPLRKLYYAKWEGSPRAFFVSENLWKSFDRNLLSLRQRLVFNFDPENLRGVRVCFAGRIFDIVKENDQWMFAKNSSHAEEKVDPIEARSYAELLRSVIIGEFLDDEDWKDDQYGLRLKQNYISVYFKEAKPQILYLGYPSREFNGTYVHMDKVFDLGLIHSKLARYLEREPESFYDRRIWKESKRDIDQVIIQDKTSERIFLKQEKGWQQKEGAYLTAENKQWLENLLAVIYQLKYVSMLESNLKEVPLHNDSLRIKLYSMMESKDMALLEMDLINQGTKIEGVINRPLPYASRNREEKYSIYKLNQNDAEILSDLIRHLR